MDPSAARANILLLHDEGELRELVSLLEELGIRCQERSGGATRTDLRVAWDVVVATPQRMLEFEEALPWAVSTRVAILDGDSRTLRSALRRADIDYIVRRPVHREALRLLFLHLLYRGPEKRRDARVSVGAAIRFRAGWRRRSAILAELSVTGCRLITDEALAPGRQLSLQIPPEVAGGRSMRLLGTVLRCQLQKAGAEHSVALAFDALPERSIDRLEQLVALHREGPAVYATAPPEAESDDRRRHTRHALSRRIIALAADSAPVLVGRDLSMGGMRVESHPELSPGTALQLAVHVRPNEAPLVVRARVVRDDGPRGLVLEFEELSESARAYLARMVDALPILEIDDAGGHSGLFLSRLLSRNAA